MSAITKHKIFYVEKEGGKVEMMYGGIADAHDAYVRGFVGTKRIAAASLDGVTARDFVILRRHKGISPYRRVDWWLGA